MVAMEMLSSWCLSYCRSGKWERAACRSVLTLCKWLLADWKDLTPQLKQVGAAFPPSLSPPSSPPVSQLTPRSLLGAVIAQRGPLPVASFHGCFLSEVTVWALSA